MHACLSVSLSVCLLVRLWARAYFGKHVMVCGISGSTMFTVCDSKYRPVFILTKSLAGHIQQQAEEALYKIYPFLRA